MNSTRSFVPILFVWLASVVLLGCGSLSRGDAPQTNGQVTAIQGRAQYSSSGGSFAPLKSGTVLHAGDVVQTATDSAVDIHLNATIGTVRLTQSTTLAFDKLAADEAKAGGDFEVHLDLRSGELLGKAGLVPSGSKFQVKTPNGFAGIRQGQFRLDSRSRLVLLDGAAVLVHIPASGDPAPFTLKAPPASFFSPGNGVQPAPRALEREVSAQIKSKLPK